MARLNVVDPASASGRVREIFDGPLKGKHFNLFKGMANSPAALDAYLGMAGAMGRSGLSAQEQEAVQLAIAEANACGYCAAAHTAIGVGAGLTPEQVLGARRGKVGDPRLNAVVQFALALHEKRGHVSAKDLQEFRAAGFTDAHVAEVVLAYALATYTNLFNHVNETTVDFPAVPTI